MPASNPAFGTFDEEGNYTPREIVSNDLGMSFADAIAGLKEEGRYRVYADLERRAGAFSSADLHHHGRADRVEDDVSKDRGRQIESQRADPGTARAGEVRDQDQHDQAPVQPERARAVAQ